MKNFMYLFIQVLSLFLFFHRQIPDISSLRIILAFLTYSSGSQNLVYIKITWIVQAYLAGSPTPVIYISDQLLTTADTVEDGGLPGMQQLSEWL